jgi:hypothetical protein
MISDEEILKTIIKNPVRFARGFIEVGPAMKTCSNPLYNGIRKLLIDLMGADRLKTIYEEHQRDLKGKERFSERMGKK